MIDDLTIGTSANFFARNKPLSSNVITKLFADLRRTARKPSRNVFEQVRAPHNGSLVSAISFSQERAPSFLTLDAQVFDRIHGYVLIIERGEFVAVFKSGFELPSGFKSRHLGRADPATVEAAIATADAVFGKIRVKSTSSSKQGVRAKMIEAADLAESMPLASASRFFTQGYSVSRPDGYISATPSTGRIAKRGDRGDAIAATEWASAVIDQLAIGGAAASLFIRNFARRIALDALPEGTAPILFSIDIPRLTELALAEEPTIRLVRADEEDNIVALTNIETEEILSSFDEAWEVKAGRPYFRIWQGRRRIGSLRILKSRISFRLSEIAILKGVEVEDIHFPLGLDEGRVHLARYLDREDLFTVLFDEPTLAYVQGELFRNEAMLDGGTNFLRHILTSPTLANATSEKGDFVEGQPEFSEDSVFRQIVDDIAANNNILICDDLGDEWADFIGINSLARPPSICFYHGKHGVLTLGASAFHVAVSQAEKNLGHLTLSPHTLDAKYNSWSQDYTSGSGVLTSIQKIIKGGQVPDIRESINAVRGAPDAVRHVYIVTSSLSKAAVQSVFNDLQNGARPTAYFVQLYWLLTQYFSACAEMGAVGFVICQE